MESCDTRGELTRKGVIESKAEEVWQMEKLKKDEFPDQWDERFEASREINEEVEVAGVGGGRESTVQNWYESHRDAWEGFRQKDVFKWLFKAAARVRVSIS